MPSDGNEPQSYGSGEDWVTGETGEEINPPKSAPSLEHREFYDPRRESETSAPHQGGNMSGVQLHECAHMDDDCEHVEGAGDGENQPISKVTSRHGGAKHDSFFRKRDYP